MVMRNTDTQATTETTFTVTVDPTAARSIVAKYDNPTEAAQRFNRELDRISSGTVTLWKTGKIIAREEKGSSLMTTCTETTCQATFNYIAERNFPTLCIEHAADADRSNGWTPENSQN